MQRQNRLSSVKAISHFAAAKLAAKLQLQKRPNLEPACLLQPKISVAANWGREGRKGRGGIVLTLKSFATTKLLPKVLFLFLFFVVFVFCFAEAKVRCVVDAKRTSPAANMQFAVTSTQAAAALKLWQRSPVVPTGIIGHP